MTHDLIPYEYPDVVASFLEDLGLTQEVGEDQKGTPEERLTAVLSAVGSLFSLDVPTIGDDPMQVLREVARDTKLSNITRERALYRLYLLTRKTKLGPSGTLVPLWFGLADDEGVPLETQETLIGWFTSKSGLGRASTFRRIRVYQRLAEFGIEGEDAWLRVLQMPTVMQELLNEVADWERNEFTGVDPDLALGVARYVKPDAVGSLAAALETGETDTILGVYTPVIQAFLDEADSYPSAKEALAHIRIDILRQPVITYRWVVDEQVIGIRLVVPIVENGEPVSERTYNTVLFIDDPEPPKSLMTDLFKRLPIGNRHDLPGA